MIVGKIAVITSKTLLLINSEPNLREVVQACLMDLGGLGSADCWFSVRRIAASSTASTGCHYFGAFQDWNG
jgi:hypothetical protein